MAMMVSITCDGCGDYFEASIGYEDGANAIDASLDPGWTHEVEDYCPKCADDEDD